MPYEVELKFRTGDWDTIRDRLNTLGAVRGTTVRQEDTYFAHPSRNFAETDEALRIRRIDSHNRLTYKGPLIDSHTKTRHEVEIPFAEGPAASHDLEFALTSLGFEPFHRVLKTRTTLHLRWEECDTEIALDEIDGLGRFIEIEATADADTLDAVRESVLRLAAQLELGRQERRSYLRLLLDLEAAGPREEL